MKKKSRNTLKIGDKIIEPGANVCLDLITPDFFAHLPASMPIQVIRSNRPGPRIFITSTIHGDEIIGIDIIFRLLQSGVLDKLLIGDVILVPVVNMFGFVMKSRELPDRRDMNRFFPGSARGSLTSRLAHLFINEVVKKCTHGIDLHSGATNHFNLPQIRIDVSVRESIKMAEAFAAPVTLDAAQRPGSLRTWCKKNKISTILFEGSEAGRVDEHAAEIGFQGIVNVLAYLGMIKPQMSETNKTAKTIFAKKASWIRSTQSGMFRPYVKVGDHVKENQTIGHVSNLFGVKLADVNADHSGVVIGQNLIPAVNEGDALFNIGITGTVRKSKKHDHPLGHHNC